MTNENPQELLFQRMREILPSHLSLVDVVSEILRISNESAFSKIKGETPLVLEEVRQLCVNFDLSLDQSLKIKTGSILFQATRVDTEHYSFNQYLSGILEQLQMLEGFLKKEIIYLCKDIPLFHQFVFQPYFAFRYFFWMKSILLDPAYTNRGFSFNCLDPSIIALGDAITQAYNNIPSIEIWNTECINSIIFQVEYYKEAGFFSSAGDIRIVYDAVEETINHIKNQAENGYKFIPDENIQGKKNNYKLYYNRVILGDNTILAIADHLKTVHLVFDVLNYMTTRDETFCNDTQHALQNLMKRSSQISSVNEKQRNIFFNTLIAKIHDRKRHL